MDADGNVFVGEVNGAVRKVTPAGVVTTVLGGSFSFTGGTVALRALPGPAYGLAIDASDVLYVGTGGEIWRVRLQ